MSNNSRIASPDLARVNVLFCTTLRRQDSARAENLKKNEVLLDEADGLDWLTICKCDAMHFVQKSALYNCRGKVTAARQIAISRKIADTFELLLA
ncbi:MAG: hypothetical protein FJ398_24425 [Verrucomicrobia bacterium]|nr:hypothetical protein [Verrucomicrobiota bacterium]